MKLIKKAAGGFTLIELLVVLVILAAITGMVAPQFIGRGEKAKIDLVKSDLKVLEQQIELFRLDNYNYPSTDQGLAALLVQPTGSPEAKNWQGPYLKSEPRDPWGNLYLYINLNGAIEVLSLGADGQPGGLENNADISSVTP